MSKLKMLLLSFSAVIILLYLPLGTAYAYSGIGTVNCIGYLNVRESPGTDAKIIDKLYPGTKVTIVDNSGDWYKINYEGKTGWASSTYITIESSDGLGTGSTGDEQGTAGADYNLKRMQGTDRYATAVEISKAGWQSSQYVVLATGEQYPDALCAAPLAEILNSPVLLTQSDHMDEVVINEIKRLGVTKAYIVGGQGAVSVSIENTLKAMGVVYERTYGSDRYETSAAIASKYFKTESEAVVVTGEDYPDAISIASISAAKKIPILLTDGTTITKNINNYIKSAGITSTYIAGGTGVVSKGVENLLPNPIRLGGSDRYETNIDVLNYFSNMLNLDNIYIATGEDFPDALAGSVLAAKKSSPVLLISSHLSNAALEFINDNGLTLDNVQIFGGEGAVSSSIVKSVFPAPPPESQFIKGIDVSRWQGEIDWNAVKNAGYSFVFVKISGANSSGLYTDANALKNVQGAKNAGLIVGGYHYGYFENIDEAVKEADYFKSVASDMGLGYVALDIEYKGLSGDLTQASLAFLDSVSDIAKPVLYSSPSFIRTYFNSSITKYPLWIANYGVSTPSVPIWSDWVMWQQSNTGSVPGISVNVDIDVMKQEFFTKK